VYLRTVSNGQHLPCISMLWHESVYTVEGLGILVTPLKQLNGGGFKEFTHTLTEDSPS
jgi:hypothetical protein